MTIDYWEEISEAEIKNISKMEIISHSNTFHVEEIRMTYKGELYRQLFEISTGNLIVSEKFRETVRYNRKIFKHKIMNILKEEFESLGWQYDSTIEGGDLYIHNTSVYPITYYLMYSGQIVDMYMAIHNERSYSYYGRLETKDQLEQLMKMLQFI